MMRWIVGSSSNICDNLILQFWILDRQLLAFARLFFDDAASANDYTT
jgi:hypothetical protein